MAAEYTQAGKYADGDGVAQSDAEALLWYHKAAALGHVEAMLEIGNMFAKSKDYANALLWYRKAGGDEAEHNIRVLYNLMYPSSPLER
jgi:TPR repeat protein